MARRLGCLIVIGVCLNACGADNEPDAAPSAAIATDATLDGGSSVPTVLSIPGTQSPSSAASSAAPPTTTSASDDPSPSSAATSVVPTRATVEFRPVVECGDGSLTASIPPTQPPPESGLEVLGTADGLQMCLVGPVGANQQVLDVGSAQAGLDQNGQWVVTVDVRPDGQAMWDALGRQCYEGDATCPSHQLAIVVDGVVQSAPYVQTPDLPGSIQIAGGFTEDEVRALAQTINRA